MFQAVDLSSNFYFSYGYDLTHTLQYNYADPKYFTSSNIFTLSLLFNKASLKQNFWYQ
jgi:hypothetical protein